MKNMYTIFRQTDRPINLSFCDVDSYSWQEYLPDG